MIKRIKEFIQIRIDGTGLFLRDIKFFFQKITRGYGDDDLWSLDTFIIDKILPPLKAFAKRNRMGYPAWLLCQFSPGFEPGRTKITKTLESKCEKEWQRIIDEMIWAFEFIKKDNNCEIDYTNRKELLRLEKRKEEGLKLFIEHFQNLWGSSYGGIPVID